MSITSTMSDTELQHKIQQELDWDPHVDASGIAAKVENGVVTLTGFVDMYAKKLAARDAVHRVRGVLDIADEVQVWLAVRAKTDQEIAQAVRSALMWDVFIPDEKIKSTVAEGWVTLEGKLDQFHQREDAGRAVERLAGVFGVTNKIEVKPQAVDPAKIRTSIEDALSRRAEREAKRIQVRVDGNVVTLTGSVDSWAEKNAVERVAYYSRGVKRLENKIEVDPYI